MSDTNSEIIKLKQQLSVARKEIGNLRQQLKKISAVHSKDVNSIRKVLSDFKCENCVHSGDRNEIRGMIKNNGAIEMTPIGCIRTEFKDKKGVPRQPSVGGSIRGCLQINQDVFTNPEHSIDGLSDFSHLWILYHFHKNSAHAKAKVAPPRLNGKRVGVFSCRTPHRPCPIGLSLVQIDEIDGANIYFFGTDMVDGTPVFDIKPYIPQYDDPNSVFCNVNEFFNTREAPDGQETSSSPPIQAAGAASSSSPLSSSTTNDSNTVATPVKVPPWILSNHRLRVLFAEQASEQIHTLNIDPQTIIEVLSSDPRSIYLRTNYHSQFYTFQIGHHLVISKFNDDDSTVTVLKVRKNDNFSELQSSCE